MRRASLALSLLLLVTAPRMASAQELVEVVVRRGETCRTLARRLYGDPDAYGPIHAHNPELGPTPHHLVAGMRLRVPAAASAPATLSAVHRTVERRDPEAATFSRAARGAPLPRGTQVRTHEASTAEITFRDDTRVTVRERTLVIVYGGRERLSQRAITRAELERGALRSRLGELAGRRPLEVETPSSTASVDGDAVVSVEEDGTSRVANHSRREATVLAAGERVRLPAGTGTVVRRGERASAPRELLLAPRWRADRSGVVLGLVGRGASLSGGFDPVPGAARYRVEVSRQPDGGEVLRTLEVPGEARRFEADGLPEGAVYVAIASIDASGLEGRRSPWRAFGVRLARLVEPGGTTAPVTAEIPRVWPGTWLVAPRGMDCAAFEGEGPPPELERAVGEGADAGSEGEPPRPPREAAPAQAEAETEAAAETATEAASAGILTLRAPGPHHVRCYDRAGHASAPLALEVLRAAPSLEGTALRDRAATVEVRLGLPRSPPPRALAFELAHGRVTGVRESQGSLTLTLWVPRDAPDETDLSAFVLAGAERVPIFALALPIGDPAGTAAASLAPPPATRAAPPRPRLAQGAFGDHAWPSVLGLRDERLGGLGAWLGLAALGTDGDPQLRVSAGARAEIPETPLRIAFQSQLDLLARPDTPERRGEADLVVGVGALLLDEGPFGLAVDLTTWIPTRAEAEGSLGRVRLAPSLEASWRPAEWLALRARPGAVIDAREIGARLFAFALGLDVAPLAWLSLGVELDGAAGTFADRAGADRAGAALALGGAIEARGELFAVSAGARFGLTDEGQDLLGPWSGVLSVRLFAP